MKIMVVAFFCKFPLIYEWSSQWNCKDTNGRVYEYIKNGWVNKYKREICFLLFVIDQDGVRQTGSLFHPHRHPHSVVLFRAHTCHVHLFLVLPSPALSLSLSLAFLFLPHSLSVTLVGPLPSPRVVGPVAACPVPLQLIEDPCQFGLFTCYCFFIQWISW